jgi:hypothetical protein
MLISCSPCVGLTLAGINAEGAVLRQKTSHQFAATQQLRSLSERSGH